MFVVSNFLNALAVVIGVVLDLLWWLIIIRALLSWVNPDPYNPIVQFIERTTEPVIAPFRKIVPAHSIGIDLAPLFAILMIYFLKIFLVQTLVGFAVRLS